MRAVYRWSWLLVLIITACSLGQQQSTPTPQAEALPTAVLAVTATPEPLPTAQTVREPLSCDQIVASITERVDSACSGLGRNQACYGSRRVTAQFISDTPLSRFESSGDIVNLSDLSRISASPFDELTQDWGIALIKAQANLPDTLPGQNVLIMLMGDTEALDFNPGLQAVTFRTGVGDPQCASAPPSAILVQSPGGSLVTMNINGADVTMGSTLYFTAEVENQLTIGVLEGSGLIEANGEVQYLPPGQQVGLPLGGDTGLEVIGSPSTPEPIPLEQVVDLPIELLDRPIELPELPTEVPAASPTDLPASTPAASATANQACNVRTDWANTYVVQPGDNLFRIALRAGISLSELQIGNCIADTTQIEVGQVLRAPNVVATETPVPLDQTLTAVSSITPTATSSAPTQTFTPTVASFRADQTVLGLGQCTTLRWDVDNISAVYIDGQPTTGHASQSVCPRTQTTYTLTVVHPDSKQLTYTVTISVGTITPTPSPTITPGPTNFRADQYTLIAGMCTMLRWDTLWNRRLISDAFLQITSAGKTAVIPVYGLNAYQDCPNVNSTYTLNIVSVTGTVTSSSLTINVFPPTLTPSNTPTSTFTPVPTATFTPTLPPTFTPTPPPTLTPPPPTVTPTPLPTSIFCTPEPFPPITC